jgi:hypothetical protein
LLEDNASSGGVDKVRSYIRSNALAINARARGAPVIVVLDWDAASQKASFEGLVDAPEKYKVLVWPTSCFNPNLNDSFRGLERHLPDRIIDAADRSLGVIGTTNTGQRTIARSDLSAFKSAVNQVICSDLRRADLQFASRFIEDIVAAGNG